MAIVLVILAFVLAALLLPLQAQRNQLAQSQTKNTLELAKKALLGYAQANGRLPCPATSNGTSVFPDDSANANPLIGGLCNRQLGFFPAATLGLEPTDVEGYLIDAWNNRIMYAVAQSSTTNTPTNTATPDFTTNNATDGLAIVGMGNLIPELRVCGSSTGITTLACSGAIPETNYLINNAVVVVYSIGATGSEVAGGADEGANPTVPTARRVFVSHEPRSAADPNGEFDHIVTWISPYVLYNAMIEAGQLH
jgi:type II secretory pathway pseudopilin PulG